MKHYLSLFFLLLVITPQLLKSEIIDNCGFIISVNQSKIKVEEYEDYTRLRTGLGLSLFLEKKISTTISSVIHVEYIQKGFITEQIETNEVGEKIQTVKANTRLDYISVPLLMKFTLNNVSFSPFIKLGPRFEYMFNYQKGTWEFTNIDFTDETAKYLDKTSFGYTIATGCQIPCRFGKIIIIEARYNHDFTDLWSQPYSINGKNISYDLGIGIVL